MMQKRSKLNQKEKYDNKNKNNNNNNNNNNKRIYIIKHQYQSI